MLDGFLGEPELLGVGVEWERGILGGQTCEWHDVESLQTAALMSRPLHLLRATSREGCSCSDLETARHA